MENPIININTENTNSTSRYWLFFVTLRARSEIGRDWNDNCYGRYAQRPVYATELGQYEAARPLRKPRQPLRWPQPQSRGTGEQAQGCRFRLYAWNQSVQITWFFDYQILWQPDSRRFFMELIDSHTHLYCDDFLTEEQPKHPKKGVILPPPLPTPRGGEEAA